MSGPSELVAVPDLVGLEVGEARGLADSVDLFVTGGNPDGPPISALTWPGRWVVTAQRPSPGALVRRAAWIVVDVEKRGGGDAGDREPRVPRPPAGTILAERSSSPDDVE